VWVFCDRLVFSASGLFAQAQESVPSVEISFQFSWQSGYATNQFAVWVEDASGNVVKTLDATSYAATGDWTSPPLPQRAEDSNLFCTFVQMRLAVPVGT